MPRSDRRIQRTRRGDFRVRLPASERAVLASLPSQLRDLLAGDDPALARLFPPAYADDPEADAEYRRLMHEDLVEGRLSSLDVLEATLSAERVTEDQLAAWLGALNDLRLVLGTRLDVTEDLNERPMSADDPRASAFGLYLYLGWLEEQVVEALAGGLDPGGSEGVGGAR
jgi:hypothetical protein